jgi:hypothetical protein
MRYELTDDEWAAIKTMLPNKPRGDDADWIRGLAMKRGACANIPRIM